MNFQAPSEEAEQLHITMFRQYISTVYLLNLLVKLKIKSAKPLLTDKKPYISVDLDISST
jgi:hypothetical protein